MILHHKTTFVIAERKTSRSPSSTARAYAARERVAAWLAAGRADHRAATGGTHPAGLVLTCRPGSNYGAVLDELARRDAAAGAEYGWKGHYQGGSAGFAQRESDIAPGQTDSRWHGQPVAAGHAVAWNPSLPGGAKAEDTYLVVADGQLLRVTDAPGWPAEEGDVRRPPRPAVLEAAA